MRRIFAVAVVFTLTATALIQPAAASDWQDTGTAYRTYSDCFDAGDNGVDQEYWLAFQCRGTRPNVHLWVNYG